MDSGKKEFRFPCFKLSVIFRFDFDVFLSIFPLMLQNIRRSFLAISFWSVIYVSIILMHLGWYLFHFLRFTIPFTSFHVLRGLSLLSFKVSSVIVFFVFFLDVYDSISVFLNALNSSRSSSFLTGSLALKYFWFNLFFWSMFLIISWHIKGLFCSLVSLFFIFISRICISRRTWINIKSISREVSVFSSSIFKISCQLFCSSFLKASWLNALRLLLKRNCLLIVVFLCDLFSVYQKLYQMIWYWTNKDTSYWILIGVRVFE